MENNMKKNVEGIFEIKHCHVRLKFEPLFNMSNQLLGYEALSTIHYQEDSNRKINPEVFFSSLTADESLSYFQHQIDFAKKYSSYFIAQKIFLSMNICENILLNYPWESLKDSFKEASDFIRLEVNENIEPRVVVRAALERIRRILPVWLDDFSRSSFCFDYVLNGPFDGIKIDKDLYWTLRETEQGINYLTSLCRLFTQKNKIIIIEGIETDNDLKNIMKCGCDAGQGWLWPSITAELINSNVNDLTYDYS
ncbi:EAL domain-containing protein [Citrobacter sp. wls710]|nr:EAL domain-containing protein [Citrobacter sp. wls710]